MRAKASIPAWAKATLAVATVSAIFAALVGVVWFSSDVQTCGPLRENVALVQRGVSQRRVSDTIRSEWNDASGIAVIFEAADFRGPATTDQVASCLGPDWRRYENVPYHGLEATSDATIFLRSGWPVVLHLRSRTDLLGRVKTQIRVEQLEPERDSAVQ